MKAPNLSFSHFGINVIDLDKMVEFYTRVLGFTVTDRGPIGDRELAFLSRDPTEHHEIVLGTGRPREASTTVNQMSFRLPSLEDLKAAQAALVAEGIGEMRIVSHGNAWSVYFHDPESNRIEFFVDAPWYTSQPHAEPLDLTASTEDIMKTTEADCRRDPGFLTREEWSRRLALKMRSAAASR